MILDSAARLAPRHVAGAVAFEVGVETYTWEDIVLAAILWGEWQQVRTQVRAALRSAGDLQSREVAPTDAEIEHAADAFRYARDLITADETETWLSRRGLGFDELLQYVERGLARRWSALRLDGGDLDGPSDDDVESAVWAEAVFSGWLSRLADRLALQAAVHEQLRRQADAHGDGGRGPTELAASRPAMLHTCPRELHGGGALGLDESPLRRCQWLRHLDDCFQQYCGGLITPRALQDEIHLHQLEWVRLRIRYALFADEDAAREALLCVRLDGQTLAEAAARAGVSVREDCLLLEEIDEPARGAFLAAAQDELLGPVGWAGKHGIVLMLEKCRPSVDDAATRERARETVLARVLQEQADSVVRWHERF